MFRYTAMRAELDKVAAVRAGAAIGAAIGAGKGIYDAPKKETKRQAVRDVLLQGAGGALAGGGVGRAVGLLGRAGRRGQAAGLKFYRRIAQDLVRRIKKEAPGVGQKFRRGAMTFGKKAAAVQELAKLAQNIGQGQVQPTGLSGLGTHISRTVSQRGGTFNMMMLGMQDSSTSQFAQQLLDLTKAGRYGQARQLVVTANFPDEMRTRILGSLDHIRSQPAIPEQFRLMGLLSAFDAR